MCLLLTKFFYSQFDCPFLMKIIDFKLVYSNEKTFFEVFQFRVKLNDGFDHIKEESFSKLNNLSLLLESVKSKFQGRFHFII